MVNIEGIRNRFRPRWQETQAGRELLAMSPRLTVLLRSVNVLGKQGGTSDFDVAPQTPGTIVEYPGLLAGPMVETRRQARLNYFREFRQQIEKITRPQNPRAVMQLDFLIAKLGADEAFFMNIDGQGQEPLEYIEATMGVKPEIIGEERLQAQTEIVKDLLRQNGYPEYNAETITAFRDAQKIDITEVPDILKSSGEVVLRNIGDFIGEKIEPTVDIQTDEKNEYWFNWTSGDRRRFKLTINTHPRHDQKMNRGKIQAMASHEYCHLAQMKAWQNEIDEGQLLPVLGITSVHDPEQVTLEGIAQTLHRFLPRANLSSAAEIELEMEGLRQMVYNNVHITVNTEGQYVRDVVEYVRKYLPAESASEIRKQIRERTKDPVKKTYLYSYGIGFLRHQWYAANLNPEGKRELLRLIFSQPTTPQQEHQYVEGLLNDPRGRFGKIIIPFDDFIANDKTAA